VKNPKFRLTTALAVLFALALASPATLAMPFKWPTKNDKQPAPAAQDAKSTDSSKSTDTTPAANQGWNPNDTSQNPPDATAADATPAAADSSVDQKKYPPGDAVKHYNRGVELHTAGFMNQAVEEYKQALNCNPKMEQAWSNLGAIYTAQRSWTHALEAFEKALAIKPDRATTLNGMAAVLYSRGKVSEAKEKWLQAVKVDPTFASGYYNVGNAFEGEHKPMDAINYYEKAIQINPQMADAYYRIGCVYVKEKHPAQAELLLIRAVELSPDADWVKDAKKQLNFVRSDYEHDIAAQSDVKMNMVPPQSDSAPAAVREQKPQLASGDTSAKAAPVSEKPTKQKKHKAKKVDMFVTQQADSPSTQAADLQEKPAE
jgi:tetratricopeptide (TPR) repeat protein